MVHLLGTDPAGSFVATGKDGKIVGFAMSQVREDEWYLAFLFVLPSHQSRGVGQKLLAKAMKYGTDNQCKRQALATYAYNPQAIAVYSKLGMTPQRQIMMMGRTVDNSKPIRRLKPKIALTQEIIADEKWINRLTRLDRRARKLARPEEHFYWVAQPKYSLVVFHDGKRLAGYSVQGSMGLIGPIVASRPEYLTSIMALTIEFGVKHGQARQVISLSGEHRELMTSLLAAGFRVLETNLLMATENIADSAIYIPGHLAIY